MRDYTLLYSEYDQIMIGKRNYFSDFFFKYGNAENMKNALVVMRYAFCCYLRWPPEILIKCLNREVMEKCHLQSLMQYIDYPIEYKKETDYYYLVTLIFKRYKLTFYDKTVHTYENILAKNTAKFAKNYFLGYHGKLRACICLQYIVNHYVDFHSINELYYIFASEKGYQILKDMRLLPICQSMFETPIDYLNLIIPDDNKSELYYYFYKYKYLMEMFSEKGRKRKPTNAYILQGENLS